MRRTAGASCGAPVAPAQRSPAALAKAATKATPGGGPVHSLATLLDDLATITANRIQPAGGLPPFTVITTPTPLQRQAFDFLGVSHRRGHAWSDSIRSPHISVGRRPTPLYAGGTSG